MSKIKSIVLDLDGVYFKPGGLWHFSKWMQKKLNKTDEEVHTMLKNSGFFDDAFIGKITEDQVWDNFEEQIGESINFDRQEAIYEMCADFKKDEELINYVSKLKEKYGIKLGICSNLEPSSVTSRKLHGIEPEGFNFKIYSFEVGFRKPDKRIFEIVIEKSECKPQEIVYLDDQESKLPEAKELGINTSHYKGFDEFQEFIKHLNF